MSDSRLEKFIYAICSMEVSDLPVPLSRIEILWNCLITGETPDFEPQSRNEKYLMAMLGLYELENLPIPMSRGEKFLYKIAMGETDLSDVPGYLSRYEELLKYLIENGVLSDFEYVLYTLNQSLSTLYQTVEKPVKSAILSGNTLINSLGISNVFVPANTESAVNLGLQTTLPPKKYILFYNVVTENTSPNEPLNRHTPRINLKDGSSLFQGYEGFNTTTGRKYWIFTANSDIVDVYYWVKNISTDVTVNNCMLLEYQEGMENWDIPFFEGMQSVKMPVLSTIGKNLFDGKFTKYEGIYGYYYLNNGTYTCSITDNDTSVDVSNLSFGVKDTGIIWFFDEGAMYNTKRTITNGKLIFYPNTEEAFNKIKQRYHIQIEEGTVATPYEPYKSNILSTSEDVVLKGIGDVQDTLNCNTGEYVEHIGEVMLDGVNQSYDSYGIHSANSNLRYIVGQVSNPCKFTGNYNRNTCVSDKISTDYGYAHLTDSDWGEGIALNGRYFKLVINLDRLSEDNLGGVKTYLSQNPITIQYELATPVVKTVDLTTVDQDGQPTKLKTFNDISYVEINADNLIPSVDVEVATKISETLATIEPQQLNISNTQNQLGQTIDEQAENTDATMMATTEIYEQTL